MRCGALLLILLCVMTGCGDVPWGHQYLGARYESDPLGEGFGYDPDPLIRFDAFDCTTFVETVLAHGDVDDLCQIRYDGGRIDFVNRNHFIETDWLKNNADRIENISTQIAPTTVRRVTIDRANWMRRVHGIHTDDAPVTVDLQYVPYDRIPAMMNPRRPMVVLFITDGTGMVDKIGTDLGVVHMGFLGKNGILRHASSQHGRVMDINFDDYVAMRKKSRHNLGVMFLRIK